MAEKRKNNAKMNAKGLEDALTDDEAGRLIEAQGGRSLLLVEAVHGPYTTALDGSRTINLLPGVVVLVPDEHAKPVRDLLRSLAVGGGQTLQYDDAGDAFVPGTDDAAAAVRETADKAKAATPDATAGDGEWDGDPDAPAGLSAVPDPEGTCDFPGCLLPAEHDGDHSDTEADG